jgi:DNA-binding MarR family transcriptional regulator
VYRHGTVLASADQIASLVSYEIAAVDSALKQLELEKLVERSRISQGVCFFRFLAPTEAERRRRLWQLISLLENRVGRGLVVNQLKLDQRESRHEECLFDSGK